TVMLAGFDRLIGTYTAHSFGTRTEAGYRIDFGNFAVAPYGALQVQAFTAPSYTESALTGASTFALTYDSRIANTGRGEFGTWLQQRLSLNDDDTRVILRGRLAYAHSWSTEQIIGGAFPALPGSNFTVMGAPLAPNSMLASLGADVRWRNGVSFSG